jgi:hypothetical protein
MNIFRKLLIYSIAASLLAACNEGIDPISPLDPGPDEAAPQIIIRAPTEGYQIMAPQAVAPLTISFEASDDIELGSVTVSIDGNQIASFNEFKDYRRFVHQFVYDNVPTGTHVLQITATDLDGKSTTQSVNFEKVPPYSPVYPGEIFYMPFNGDFTEMISFEEATVVGNPGFTSQNVQGGNAYAGANESYLTFPGEELQNAEFSAVFWMNVNATPNRAGILVMSPEDPANPDAQNIRTSGFRFFREDASGMQRFKLNVGTGADEVWVDGGANADVDPAATDWVHFAFTISATQAIVYINGNVAINAAIPGIDWTGTDLLSIMSGAPRFTEWDHFSDQSFMDELRIFNRALTQADIQAIIEAESGEIPQFEGMYGEIFYMPFDGDFVEQATGTEANITGSPGFGEGISGEAYAGAVDSYLTFPADRIQNNTFSATFWMNVNAEPERAGILTLSPEDTENAGYPDTQNLRTSGFRFFREAHANGQIFKLNVGTGESDSWFDGGANATVDPEATEWVHFAFTISESHSVIYINGEVVSEGDFAGIDWTGADLLTIMSGVPRFTEWDHFSDLSLMDELRIFDRVLTLEEIQTMISDMNQ